jgi:phosphoglycolate phosphatase
MAKFQAVFFDFDGTFADTSEGVLQSYNYALVSLGFPPQEPATFGKFLGPPLQASMMEFCGMTPEQSAQAIALYREAYDGGNCFRLRVFDGMEALLRRLRAEGIRTGIASSKPTVFLEKILAHLELRDLLDAVCGVDLQHMGSDKSTLIAQAARIVNVPHTQCLMVGDRRFDMEGAAALGMTRAGVLYGFGTEEELKQSGANFLATDVAALEAYILEARR